MDVFNSDTWKQQLAAFMNYPYIMAPFLVIVAAAVWWFRGWQIKVFEARLQFADERAAGANEAKDEVVRQFNDLKAEVAAQSGNGTLAARVAKVEEAIEKLSVANNAVRSAIGVSDSLANTPLAMRVQAEATKSR